MSTRTSNHVTGTAGTEGGRRPTGVPAVPVTTQTTEVIPSPKRRRLSVSYKIKVIETVRALKSQDKGAIGAYLRSEGLYYSSVHHWEKQYGKGRLTAAKTGRRQKSRENLLSENTKLHRQLEQIKKRLERTELIVDLQKKLSKLMETDNNLEMSAVN